MRLFKFFCISCSLFFCASADIVAYRKPSFACHDTRCKVLKTNKYCFVICKLTKKETDVANWEQFLFKEPDRNFTLQNVPVTTIPGRILPLWNLDRIDQRKPVLDRLHYSVSLLAAKTSPNIYLFDTGVESNHVEFNWPWPIQKKNRRKDQKRVKLFDFTGESKGRDLNGHGTHCAGIMAGKNTGVHPFASITSMKVANMNGSANVSVILQALTFALSIAKNASVFSLSLAGEKSRSLELLLEEIGEKHIVVVAAGNAKSDACSVSPGGAGGNGRNTGVFTVGSISQDDVFSQFSNHGPCVDILAPGISILSAYLNNTYYYASGTSMSTPHVAGVAALLLQKYGDVKMAREALIDSATNLNIAVPPKTTKKLVKTP